MVFLVKPLPTVVAGGGSKTCNIPRSGLALMSGGRSSIGLSLEVRVLSSGVFLPPGFLITVAQTKIQTLHSTGITPYKR